MVDSRSKGLLIQFSLLVWWINFLFSAVSVHLALKGYLVELNVLNDECEAISFVCCVAEFFCISDVPVKYQGVVNCSSLNSRGYQGY